MADHAPELELPGAGAASERPWGGLKDVLYGSVSLRLPAARMSPISLAPHD